MEGVQRVQAGGYFFIDVSVFSQKPRNRSITGRFFFVGVPDFNLVARGPDENGNNGGSTSIGRNHGNLFDQARGSGSQTEPLAPRSVQFQVRTAIFALFTFSMSSIETCSLWKSRFQVVCSCRDVKLLRFFNQILVAALS